MRVLVAALLALLVRLGVRSGLAPLNRLAESIAAVGRVVASDFRDPEGLFYLSRHLAH